MTAVFWSSLAVLVYAFAGYPFALGILSLLRGRASLRDEGHAPSVSVLLSVFNEEAVIRQKIENFLQLDYPAHRIELVVVSDGCTDRTEELVSAIGSVRVRLFTQEHRGGKTRALNRGVAEAQGDVLVFTDANSMYAPDAVRRLVSHFVDPGVGLVSGRSEYTDGHGGAERSGGLYRRYEDFLKARESATVSIVGADGAIYAMRRILYEPLPAHFINDLIHPLQVVCKGFRALQESGALCREELDGDVGRELRRQTRIMAQSWLIVLTQFRTLLAAGKWGYCWALCSHKVVRWLTLPLMGLLLLSSIALCGSGWVFQAALAAQSVFYAAAVLGGRGSIGLLRIPSKFMVLHLAALLGLFRLASGNLYLVWDPRNN